jgi:hypothetical protein
MQRPLQSPWRWPAIVLLLVTAGTHLPLVPMHLEEAPYVGALFIALTVASLVLAGLLVARDTSLVWVATGAMTALAVVAFLWSRTVGLPQIGDDIGNWGEPLGFPALGSEIVATAVAAVALLHHHGRTSRKGTA